MKLFRRWFKTGSRHAGSHDPGRQAMEEERHHCFKTPAGRGPFLLSCDGRVIPLRKARFLKET